MITGFTPSVPFNGDFPNIEGTSSFGSNTSATSHAVTMPSGVQIGERLIMYFTAVGTGATHTTPSGWTLLFTAAATPRRLSVFYKTADGSEGATVTVTASVAGVCAAVVDRVSRSTGNPEVPSNGVAGLNPPSVTPSWGALNNLFVVVLMNAVATTGDPANYGDAITATATSLYLERLLRRLNASSDDPGAFTGTSSPGIVNTMAIRPLT